MKTKLCTLVMAKLAQASDSVEKARAIALVNAVDVTVDHLNQYGWGSHLYHALPEGAAPWQGVCIYLSNAAFEKPVPGRAWRQDTRAFASFYVDNGFFKHEAALTVGSDQLLYRSLAEEYWLQSLPDIGSDWASPEVCNILLVGVLLSTPSQLAPPKP